MYFISPPFSDVRSQVTLSIHKKIMKPAENFALLFVKPEDMPKIATTTNQPTRASIKAFQEIIKDQTVSITTYDHNLGFLIMVLWA